MDVAVCNVALEFADGTRRVMELKQNALLILGAEHQYVMQPPDAGAGGPTTSDQ